MVLIRLTFITISTLGDAQDFGNLVSSHGNPNSQGGAIIKNSWNIGWVVNWDQALIITTRDSGKRICITR